MDELNLSTKKITELGEYISRRNEEFPASPLALWVPVAFAFGILLLLVGLSLFRGATWARVIAIFLVAINLVAQFTWVGVYPWWSLIMIALDILVLYAVTIHGGELREP